MCNRCDGHVRMWRSIVFLFRSLSSIFVSFCLSISYYHLNSIYLSFFYCPFEISRWTRTQCHSNRCLWGPYTTTSSPPPNPKFFIPILSYVLFNPSIFEHLYTNNAQTTTLPQSRSYKRGHKEVGDVGGGMLFNPDPSSWHFLSGWVDRAYVCRYPKGSQFREESYWIYTCLSLIFFQTALLKSLILSIVICIII